MRLKLKFLNYDFVLALAVASSLDYTSLLVKFFFLTLNKHSTYCSLFVNLNMYLYVGESESNSQEHQVQTK